MGISTSSENSSVLLSRRQRYKNVALSGIWYSSEEIQVLHAIVFCFSLVSVGLLIATVISRSRALCMSPSFGQRIRRKWHVGGIATLNLEHVIERDAALVGIVLGETIVNMRYNVADYTGAAGLSSFYGRAVLVIPSLVPIGPTSQENAVCIEHPHRTKSAPPDLEHAPAYKGKEEGGDVRVHAL